VPLGPLSMTVQPVPVTSVIVYDVVIEFGDVFTQVAAVVVVRVDVTVLDVSAEPDAVRTMPVEALSGMAKARSSNTVPSVAIAAPCDAGS